MNEKRQNSAAEKDEAFNKQDEIEAQFFWATISLAASFLTACNAGLHSRQLNLKNQSNSPM
jgi:hypothetical protein